MQIMSKIRFQSFGNPYSKPFKKSAGRQTKAKGIKGYVEYMERGTKDAAKALENGDFKESVPPSSFSEVKGYQRYMEFREGSEIMFCTKGHSVDELKKELLDIEEKQTELAEKEFEETGVVSGRGGVYLPILSMREDDAIMAGVDTEMKWMEKTDEYVKEFARVAGIPEQNVRYLAAFHLKPEKERKVAGTQPHVHILIWDTEQNKNNLKLSKKQMTEIRDVADQLWCGQAHREHYAERNAARERITSTFLSNALAKEQDRINRLTADISVVSNNAGRLTQKALKDNLDMFVQIRNKRLSKQPLTQGEKGLMYKYGISQKLDGKSLDNAVNTKIKMLQGINRDLNHVVDTVLKSPEMKPFLDHWREVSLQMKSGKGKQGALKSLYEDETKLREQLKNHILKEAKESMNVQTIKFAPTKDEQNSLLDKISYTKFRDDVTEEKAKEFAVLVANLMHNYKIPSNVAKQRLDAISMRSRGVLNPVMIEQIVQEEYDKEEAMKQTSYEIGSILDYGGLGNMSDEVSHSLWGYWDWQNTEMATLGFVSQSILDLRLSDFSSSGPSSEELFEQTYARAIDTLYNHMEGIGSGMEL